MFQITYQTLFLAITLVWIFARVAAAMKQKSFRLKRELQLIFVYICIVVVARFTFFPFSKVNGQIQPLVFSWDTAFPFRINWVPFVNLLDYPTRGEILINVIGNTAMFLPLGIVWPCVYRQLNTPAKTLAAGAGFSLLIEILQLPFYDRVSDVDDLILNTLGFLLGYLIYRLVKCVKNMVTKGK